MILKSELGSWAILNQVKLKKDKEQPQSMAEMNRHMKAGDLLWKFGDHPALPIMICSPLSLIEIFINIVCKNGHVEPEKNGCIEVWDTKKNYKKYKEYFDKEYDEFSPEELKQFKGGLIQANVPYEKVYGCPWKADHVEYWGELCFLMFIGKNTYKKFDKENWEHCSGVSAAGRTFEEMIINLGKKFYKYFGRFNEDDFLTNSEKNNHKKEKRSFRVPSKDDPKRPQLKRFKMVSNPKYKEVPISEINRRWIRWLSKTAYGKKHWGSTLKDVLAGKSL